MTVRSLNAHIEGYRLRRQMRDEDNWILGMYIQSAVSVAIEHNIAGRKAKSKYIDQPLMQKINERETEVDNMTDAEIDAELRKMILAEDIAQAKLKKQGLPETILKKDDDNVCKEKG